MIYGAGSFTTAISPSLTVLLIGWSFLEGVGAALILPAIVALVAANFRPDGRPRAYGLVMAAGAIAVAIGPLIGGLFTTYLNWRLVFAGEVLIVLMILALARRIEDEPLGKRPRIDVLGIVLSAAGLGLAVFGVLRSSVWGWVNPKPDAPELFGISAVMWLILGGLFLLWLFFEWEQRLEQGGTEPLVRPSMLRNVQMVGGLRMFFFQYFVQSGVFFVVPLFLSVSLGLSAIDTGVRLLPLSLTLLLAAAGSRAFVPTPTRAAWCASRYWPCSPGRSCCSPPSTRTPRPRSSRSRCCCSALASARWRLNSAASPCRPCRRAQPGGRRPAEHRDEHRRVTGNRAGRVGPHRQPHREPRRRHPGEPGRAARGSPQGRRRALRRRAVPLRRRRRSRPGGRRRDRETASAIVEENAKARLDALRISLAVIAVVAATALFFTGPVPTRQPGATAADATRGSPDHDEGEGSALTI